MPKQDSTDVFLIYGHNRSHTISKTRFTYKLCSKCEPGGQRYFANSRFISFWWRWLKKDILTNYLKIGYGNASMNNAHSPITYKGRSLGTVLLIAAQVLVGFIHVVFGFWLLTAPRITPFVGIIGSWSSANIYSVYTIVFGFLTLLFAVLLWFQKRWGWIGTIAVLVFVIAADSLTLLDLPSVPGIPKFACYGEITYSTLVILYLVQSRVRTKYGINF